MLTLIICPTAHDPLLTALQRILRSFPDLAESAVALYESVDRSAISVKPELVIVLMGADSTAGPNLIQRLRRTTDGRILAVGPISDSRLILRALQAGADQFVDQDELETECPVALRRLFPNAAGLPKGRVFSVISVSGGCGASTLAVNLAAVAAREFGRCGLIDLNPGRGDLPSLLDVKPLFTLADACQNEARFDRAMLEKMLIPHPSGIHLLASPSRFDDVRSLGSRGVAQALSLTRELFPVTVVDLEDCVHAEQVEVLNQTNQLFLICRLDFTALRHAGRMLESLAALDVPNNLIQVVVNQFGRPNELPVEEAAVALGHKLDAFIPYDPETINAANNLGMPVAFKIPESKVSQAIARLIVPSTPPQTAVLSFLKRIKSMVRPARPLAALIS